MPKAQEVQDAAIEEATLDEFMRRDPAGMGHEENVEMTRLLRSARARYIKGEAERKQRKKEKDDG